ncbi:hypothetical protein Pyrfu_0302 [Pyrolobus fumarii 1A]|uniref:HhH-GPD family protein n=1 Tax=Pyrolobus fumarii (strain DSM 11204 / 1A) TaxID=694429 RepID=G0EFD1_PYRF1|nr:hypothetical protein [Pyrolobus fumarii]AEM38174.1 hypothetical protein Pyrfu_0302 [Pyrolobus fumarii 1A]
MRSVELRLWAEDEARATPGYSLVDTMKTYSFGWMYWGASCGLLEVCNCIIEACETGKSRVLLRAFCPSEPPCDPLKDAIDVLGLHEDLSEYWGLARGDPLVGGVADVMPGLRLRRASPWYAFLVAVCQQNASFRQGWGMLYKLHLLASVRARLPDGRVYLMVPRPGDLDESVLREARLGYRYRTVLEVARNPPATCKDVDDLRGVRGVGPYTHALVRLIACRDYSVLPLDRWLEALASKAYTVPKSGVRAALQAKFGRWVGLAALHTTIGFDAQPLRKALERLEKGLNKPGLAEPSPVSLWKYTPPEASL